MAVNTTATTGLRLLPMSESTAHLCFDKEQFLKDDFDVDSFVADCRRRVQLETLREDLHIYFKSLKNAMVELINKDYADFVNLSSNLVGMDKAINNLSVPMGQLKEEILSVRSGMDDAIKAVEDKLSARARIREKKACLQRLLNINKSVEKMEKILGISREFDADQADLGEIELSGQQIERVALEFNQLQYYVTQSKGLPLVEKIRPRIAAITVTLQHSLERSFEESLETGQADILRQCLRTYATIDKMRDAEALFRKIAVKPYMDEVINDNFLRDHPQGLKGMYAKVLEFIPKHCGLIRQVTSQTPSSIGQEVIRGYDFLVNAVWPEIATSLESRTHSIFLSGNPDVFHEKFLLTMDFVDKFELQCGTQSSVKRLRAHQAFNTFMSKWSLPVYFQLRFHEIAGSFETALSTPFTMTTDTKSPFKLHACHTLWQCLHRCWEDNVYLVPLCHRFWKLTLQLLARCSEWIEEVYQKELQTPREEPDSSSKAPFASATSPSESGEPEDSDRSRGPSPLPAPPPVTSTQLVSLVADVDILCSQMTQLYQHVIGPKFASINCQGLSILSEAFLDCKESLSNRQTEFGDHVTKEVCGLCSVHLKSANDIPRLYRRTNRDVPSKASTYVCNCLKPLQTFIDEHKASLQEDRLHKWLVSILCTVTDGYLVISSELLTSVKKMEDSLKRLKALRRPSEVVGLGAPHQQAPRRISEIVPPSSQPGSVSDDDKIRMQLKLDVEFYGQQMLDIGVTEEEVPSYQELKTLVDSSVS